MAQEISCWQQPPQSLVIIPSQLHLWRFFLHVSERVQQQFENLLSIDELTRAERLLDRKKNNDFIVARGQLRQILSQYLHQPAEQLCFSYGPEGKPALAKEHTTKLDFNLSHSGDLALVAIGNGSAVGVDLEQIDTALAYQKIADRFFTTEEIISIKNYSELRRRRGFYRTWTRKEAELKRIGVGFSGASIETSHQPEIVSKLIPICKGYLAAIAFQKKIDSVQCYSI